MICVTFVRGDFRGTRFLGAEVLRSARILQDTGYAILGHMELGGTTLDSLQEAGPPPFPQPAREPVAMRVSF